MDKSNKAGAPANKMVASGPSDQRVSERTVIDCGDLSIRIARDGTWFYHGSPIGRKPLVKLFASVLRREADGTYWLVTPAERGRVEVEDAPFTAVELAALGSANRRSCGFAPISTSGSRPGRSGRSGWRRATSARDRAHMYWYAKVLRH